MNAPQTKIRTLTIQAGAFADPIGKQLKKQGFKFNKEKVKHFQQNMERITHLKFSDILSDGATEKARQKLFSQIKRHINMMNK